MRHRLWLETLDQLERSYWKELGQLGLRVALDTDAERGACLLQLCLLWALCQAAGWVPLTLPLQWQRKYLSIKCCALVSLQHKLPSHRLTSP